MGNQEPIDRTIGTVMNDGTIYAGISPDLRQPMYAAPSDASLAMTFNEAAGYVKELNHEKYLGHADWRVPTKGELNVLFNNRAAVGGFNPSTADGCYWSATPRNSWSAWYQKLSKVVPDYLPKDAHLSVRLLCTEPKL